MPEETMVAPLSVVEEDVEEYNEEYDEE